MKFPLTDEQVKAILNDDFDVLDGDDYIRLYEYYLPDMPYGTAKARDGDPNEWIFNRLEDDFKNLIY